ncbi:MAG: M23 family metallopeptidase [Deltaproteobacteria bacterium]|nr:M23 family metallopeptidase [Deltaproteobacteria bacterium]
MRLGGYHIILIPEKSSGTRRIHLSSFTAKLVLVVGLLVIPLLVLSCFGIIHYQNRLVVLKRGMVEERQVMEQKEVLSARLADLELSLKKSEQDVEKLGKVLEIETGQVETGLGPLDTDSLLKKAANLPEKFATLEMFNGKGGELSFADIRGKIGEIDNRIDGLEKRTEMMTELNADKIRFLDATPNLMPVNGWITSDFGFRRSPYSGSYRMHYGLDIASPSGTIIRAPADGKVVLAKYAPGYGREVILDHGFGVNTLFGHASQLLVSEGEVVKRGDPIAAVGSTGSSTGPHLHYEVHVDGIPTDPFRYVLK